MIIRRHDRTAETGFLDPLALRGGTALDEAEFLGEHFVHNALAGEATMSDTLDTISEEEEGGPFLEVSGRREFARDVDGSNPLGSQPEAFPTAVHGPRSARERRG